MITVFKHGFYVQTSGNELIMKILILGAGSFGMQALKQLGVLESTSALTIVEKRRYVCMSLKLQDINSVCDDGIDYLTE